MAIEHLWSESLRPTESGVVWNSTKTNTGLRSLHQIWPQLVALSLSLQLATTGNPGLLVVTGLIVTPLLA